MSFLNGPECSTAGNPLRQFTKHVQDDKSLQRDRLVGQGPGGVQLGFRSQQSGAGQEQMMQNFLQQNGQILDEPMQEPFAMEQMRRDIDGYRIHSPLTNGNSWASEFDPAEQAQMESAFPPTKTGGLLPSRFSPAEYQSHEMIQRNSTWRAGSPASQSPMSMSSFQRPMGMRSGMGMGMGSVPYRPMNVQSQPPQQSQQSKGKGRMTELDDNEWEKQFEQMDQVNQTGEETLEGLTSRDGLKDTSGSVPQASETHMGDFEAIWRGIQAETQSNSILNGVDAQEDMSLNGETWNDVNTWDAFDGHFADSFRDPQLGNYIFEEDNPYAGTGNPYEEGLRVIREGGNLSLAALAFEAAVQKNPEHVDAWSQLGSAQAQNEKESPAIRALTQCLKLDESNLPALMGLAISYTNEGYDSTAYRTLERWLSTKYPQIISSFDLTPDTDFGFTDRHLLHEKVTELFIHAAQLSPDGKQMDPDVQVGLGVLFYGAEEYNKAVDCFEAALASTEEGASNSSDQAHLLWNRLGATLANSGRSEEAIAAYEKALTLNPNFVRARYNLGVSCINIGIYEQAAQHLLGALSMHRVVEQEGINRVKQVVGQDVQEEDVERMVSMNQSTNLLETLRRVFQLMGRRDLAEKVEVGMDIEAFRGDFEF